MRHVPNPQPRRRHTLPRRRRAAVLEHQMAARTCTSDVSIERLYLLAPWHAHVEPEPRHIPLDTNTLSRSR